ncbi:MAG: 4-hydroxy-tetrahydrodipicolinate reductase [Clostridia bacterium]|nr:4-hydroxy-tetrahydrodipicolinate reductase [Clostridia bacterium]
MVNIIVSGINGRMGRAIEAMCKNSDKYTIVAGVDVNLGIPHEFPTVSDINELSCKADALIDFSHHSAANKLCEYAAKTNTPVIFCTTGYTDEELEIIRNTSEKVAVFRSGNMSLGINLLIELSKKAAEILEDFDIEVIEQHHNQKLDAPSGTALMIADGIKEVREDSNYVYDRTQVRRKRQANEIGIHSVRGGSIVGEHEVIFAGRNENVTLRHSALSREVFADGALKAAEFIAGKPAGMYNMSDVLENLF